MNWQDFKEILKYEIKIIFATEKEIRNLFPRRRGGVFFGFWVGDHGIYETRKEAIVMEEFLDLMEITSIKISLKDAMKLTDEEKDSVIEYAMALHLYASDNFEIEVPPRPKCLGFII
ncbi:MAG: hypothetical protein K0U78_15385 [Actinomycetia bacterium]|nr:hypothetical protein [Actinomycetes bacterium]